MFNATYFTYDGVYSGAYGLRIASFDSETVGTTTVLTPTLNIAKSARAKRFVHNGIEYNDAPEYTFTILSDSVISDITRREILLWLSGRNGFKELKIHQNDLEGYYYNCVFTNVDINFARGYCVGFTVTARFDSIYGYGAPQKMKLTGNGTAQIVRFINKSDIVDDYVYPIISFKATSDSNGKTIAISNLEEEVQYPFEFEGLRANESVTVDNELKIITSSVGGDRLSYFNKNWLKLRKGVNRLQITITGEVEIECPTYILIGF